MTGCQHQQKQCLPLPLPPCFAAAAPVVAHPVLGAGGRDEAETALTCVRPLHYATSLRQALCSMAQRCTELPLRLLLLPPAALHPIEECTRAVFGEHRTPAMPSSTLGSAERMQEGQRGEATVECAHDALHTVCSIETAVSQLSERVMSACPAATCEALRPTRPVPEPSSRIRRPPAQRGV